MATSNVTKISIEFVERFKSDLIKCSKLSYLEKIEFKKIFGIQTEFEDRYVTNSRICHPSGNNSLLGISITDVSGINRDSIICNLKQNFYDHNLMEEIRCLINTIIDIENEDGVSERARIQHFMEGLKRFGTPSAYNFAIKGELRSEQSEHNNYHKLTGDMFVVKCPREPINSFELMHELVCGTAALNSLRKFIPNFSYVYDAFYCDAPIVNDSTKEVISWCINSENPVSYVVYEAVQNPTAFGDIAKNKKEGIAKNFLMYMGQISCAEYVAEILFKFAHCDLHGDNALISAYKPETSDFSPQFYIPYTFNGNSYFIPSSGGIIMFIDYGMSRVVIPGGENNQGICVGKLDSTGYFANIGISPFDAMAIADIHKLLCFILKNSLVERNTELINCVAGLLCGYFYGNENPSIDECLEIIVKQWDGRYHVPPDLVREKEWNMFDFIVYLNTYSSTKYGVILLNKKKDLPTGSRFFGDIFESHSNESESEKNEKIKEELSIGPLEIPSIFDLSQNLSNETLRTSFRKNSKIIIDTEASSIHNIMDDTRFPFFVIHDVRHLDESLEMFIDSIQKIASFLSNCKKLEEKLRELRLVQTIYNPDELSKLISDVDKKLRSDKLYISGIKHAIIGNYEQLQIFIFGTEKTGPLSEKEIDTYGTHKYFNIYDKYSKVVSIIENLTL